MSAEPDLLPCPKCGAAASLYEGPMIGGVMWRPGCDRGCFEGKSFGTPRGAADWWNERCPVAPPAPAAIVDVWDLRTDGREVHAFALRSDAEAYVDGEPHGEERCITYTGGWTWHPAGTPGELEPDAAGEDTR